MGESGLVKVLHSIMSQQFKKMVIATRHLSTPSQCIGANPLHYLIFFPKTVTQLLNYSIQKWPAHRREKKRVFIQKKVNSHYHS